MDEDKVYLIFNGYYDVAAASDALRMYNISNHIVRAPVSDHRGCSYAVMINAAEEKMSRYLLDMRDINVL